MRIKRLDNFEKLIIESELVQINNAVLDVVQADSSSWVESMDRFLDIMIAEEERRLKVILDLDELSPGLAVFLDEKTLKNVVGYVKFTKSRLEKKISDFEEYVRTGHASQRIYSAQLSFDIISLASRLQTLQAIYTKINDLVKSKGKDPFGNQVLKNLYGELNIKQQEANNLLVVLSKNSSDELKSTFPGLQQKTEKEQDDLTKKTASVTLALNKVAEKTKDEPTKRRFKFYVDDVFTSYVKNGGNREKYHRYYKSIEDIDYSYLSVVERIEKLRKWDDPRTFDDEVKKIITTITSTGRVFSEKVITHLTTKLAEAIADSQKNMELKKTSLDQSKGIKFVFEKRLPLFESVQLPVTAKQIAEASFLMRVHKFFDKLAKLMPVLKDTEMDKAMAKLGDTIKHVSAPIIHKAAGAVGGLVGGKEGKIKGQSVVHSVFKDKYLNEEGSPGVAMQVPSTVSSMGPITPPTPNSVGSGDRFDVKTKRYKRKKRS